MDVNFLPCYNISFLDASYSGVLEYCAKSSRLRARIFSRILIFLSSFPLSNRCLPLQLLTISFGKEVRVLSHIKTGQRSWFESSGLSFTRIALSQPRFAFFITQISNL